MNGLQELKINVGIDIVKNNHHATILLCHKNSNRICKQFFFSNSSKGFLKLHNAILSYQINERIRVKIAMEATAHYYDVLARWLKYHKYDLIVCNSLQAKYLRNVVKPFFKTDPIDSLVLAKGAELGLLKGDLYECRYSQLKELLQLDKKLTKDLVR